MLYKGCLPVLALVLCLVTAQSMIIPKEVKRLMATVHNLESFMKAFKLGNITIIGDRPVITTSESGQFGASSHGVVPDATASESVQLNIKHRGTHGMVGGPSKRRPAFGGKHQEIYRKNKLINRVFLGRSRVVSFSDVFSVPIPLEDVKCKPYPTVVEVPQPDHNKGFNYPFHVELHRCAGSCHIQPRIQSCEPTETENITLLGFVVSWSSSSVRQDNLHRAPLLVKMLNHTKCGCKCITKPSECNPATHRFSEEMCRCECKEKHPRCPSFHVWDPIECKCVCNAPRDVYCPRRFVWNQEKCSCVCKNTKCRTNKVRNHRNCRCYCSKKLPPCGQGFVRNRRDCKCKPYH